MKNLFLTALLLLSAAAVNAQVSSPYASGVRSVGTTLPASCSNTRLLFRLTQVDGANQPGLYICNGSAYVPAVASGSVLPASDATAFVKGSSDATKLLRFEIDGFTTGTTRVATFPNADITVARTDAAQTFTGTQSMSTGWFVTGVASVNVHTANTLRGASGFNIAWDSGAITAGLDTGIARVAAKVVEINSGTAGTAGVLLLRGQTFASLPASPIAGMHATVTDSSTATWGATITGGGANIVHAFYNGTNWVVN